jgi:hypothetical protein
MTDDPGQVSLYVATTGSEVGYSIEQRAAPGVGRRHSPSQLPNGSPWKN